MSDHPFDGPAEGIYLDRLGLMLNVVRSQDEPDSDYRRRIEEAHRAAVPKAMTAETAADLPTVYHRLVMESDPEPRWTTGQGIGFLVATVGAVFTFGGLMSLVSIMVEWIDLDRSGEDLLLAAALAGTVIGLGIFVPGVVVFERCAKGKP